MNRAPSGRKRVLIVCSSGGHLQEALLAIQGVDMDKTIATFILPHLKGMLPGERIYHLTDPQATFLGYLLNAVQSAWLVVRLRPQVVLTTGAGIAIASALFGKLMGAKLIVIETGARVSNPSGTGSFLYRFADLFIVQWPGLQSRYPRAIYGGCLL